MTKAADDAIPGRSTAVGAASRWMRAASPALRVAVAAAAPAGSPLHARMPALARDVESWPAALALAREHRLDGFLARWLSTAGRALAPAKTVAELERGLLALARREREMLAEQRAIRAALAARGIASLPYKGPSLARRLHDPAYVRYSRDLDLFVPRERVADAVAVLGDAYEAVLDGSPELDEAGDDHHILLRRRDRGLLVELHWELAPAGWGVSTAALIGPPESWPLAAADEVGGGALGSEAAADADADDGWPLARLLPAIAAHGVRHGYARLVWLGDVAAIVHRHPDLDWDETWRVASASGVATALAASLLLAERVFAVATPARARREAAGAAGVASVGGVTGVAPRALAAWLEGRLATGRTAWDPIARGVLQSLSSDGWPRRARLATRLALAPTSLDQATLPLPAGLRWLHMPLRPALVASRFLARRAASAGREGARSS